MSLCGTGKEHCCWLGESGKCKYVEKSLVEGFNWSCSLRAKVKSWNEVYELKEYKKDVQPFWDTHPAVGGRGCGDWPPIGTVCNTCGQNK